MAVLHHEVLLEETEGLLGRGGGKTDEPCVEVFEHLPPEVVDGAVRLVRDDDVEGLDGNGGVVLDRCLRPVKQRCFVSRTSLPSSSSSGSPLRMEYTRWMVEMQTRLTGSMWFERETMLDVVYLGELPPVVRRVIALELAERLPRQVAPVHQEEDPPRACVLDEAVGESAGHARLPAPRGHLNEYAGGLLG